MKFLCIGYFDRDAMAARPKAEIDAIMRQCDPHMAKLYGSGKVMVDAGLALETRRLRRVGGKIQAAEGPAVETPMTIGGAFLVEAKDMEEAVNIASSHPTVQLDEGEEFGWYLELRPIHYFKMNP